MIQKLVVIGFLFAGFLSNGAPASAQDEFYRGKVVRVIVGFPPAGIRRFDSRSPEHAGVGAPTAVNAPDFLSPVCKAH